MTAALITQEMVDSAADALIDEGVEPSSSSVQKRLGLGSFTTVKKFLDVWRANRATPVATTEVPVEIDARARDLARAIWVLAAGQGAKQAQLAREQADAEVAAARKELGEAVDEIGRLEVSAIEQSSNLSTLQRIVHDTEIALAETRVQAGRVFQLEATLAEVRKDLAAARADVAVKSEDYGRLAGEATALRAQVQELMSILKDGGKRR